MPKIILTTQIHSPIDRVFDLSRSIDLHKMTTGSTKEEAIAGKTSGLIELDETVTWRTTHFGIRQTLTGKISQMSRPHSFTDIMLKGTFKSLNHVHTFTENEYGTLMQDDFDYTSPLGVLGKCADVLFLKRYLTRFLQRRNEGIKAMAEGEGWRSILKK